jgi:hypothetical protein
MTERIITNNLLLTSRDLTRKIFISPDNDSDLKIGALNTDNIYSTMSATQMLYNSSNLTTAGYTLQGTSVKLRNNNAYCSSYLVPYDAMISYTDGIFNRVFQHTGITMAGSYALYLDVNESDDVLTFCDAPVTPGVGSNLYTYIKSSNIWNSIATVLGLKGVLTKDNSINYLFSSTSAMGIYKYQLVANVWNLIYTYVINSSPGLRPMHAYNSYVCFVRNNIVEFWYLNALISSVNINPTFIYIDQYIIISITGFTYIYSYNTTSLSLVTTFAFQTISCSFSSQVFFLLSANGDVNTIRSMRVLDTFNIPGATSISSSDSNILVGVPSSNRSQLYDIAKISNGDYLMNNTIRLDQTDLTLKSLTGIINLSSDTTVKKLTVNNLTAANMIVNGPSTFSSLATFNNGLTVSGDINQNGNIYSTGIGSFANGYIKIIGTTAQLINNNSQTTIIGSWLAYATYYSTNGAAMFSMNSTTGICTCNRAGNYVLQYTASFQNSALGERTLTLFKNGTLYDTVSYVAGSTQACIMKATVLISLTAGSTLYLSSWQSSTLVINIVSCSFNFQYVGSV